MAQQVITSFVDDLDGGEAAGTVSFGLEGKSYEIDLSEENAARLRDSLAEFVAAARKAPTARTPRMTSRSGGEGGNRTAADREQIAAMRTWARDNGHEVAERGRVPKAVVEAYQAAH